jgi:hypothetical protein
MDSTVEMPLISLRGEEATKTYRVPLMISQTPCTI